MENLSLGRLAAVLAMFVLCAGAGPVAAEEGAWSKAAFSIPSQRAFRVPSPDRKKTVRIEDLSLVVIDQGAPVPGIEGYTLLLPAEISWAPDSKSFVITANEGGADEAWFVTVYTIDHDRMSYYDVTADAALRFKAQVKCPGTDELNFGAVKWVKESKHLLIVAEVPPRADCAEKGAIWGYIVEVPSGAVLREFPPKKLVEDWGEFLGPRVLRKNLR